MSLRAKAFSGVRWTTLSSLGRTALQFIQIVVLARLLAPTDFGLMAVVMAIMAFVQMFADMGVSNAIIHHQDITEHQLSSLYWLNVGASFCLAAAITALSPLAATFYGRSELAPLLSLASLSLFINSLGQQIRVVAQKELRFSALAKVELAAAAFGFLAAIVVALLGGGVYALVASGLGGATLGVILAWSFLAQGWRPRVYFRLSEIAEFIRFGAYMIGNDLINTFNSQVDVLLGGRLLGAHAIGLYNVPKELSLRVARMINPIITQVSLPVMAKSQSDPDLLKRVYLQTMRMTASVNFPIYIAVVAFARDFVLLILGDKWVGAVTLLQTFALWGLLRSTGNPVGSLLMAKGRADLSFKWNLVWLFIVPPVIWLGSQFGARGMAGGLLGLGVVGYIPNWFFLVRPLCGAGLGEYTQQLALPLLLSVLAGILASSAADLSPSPILRVAIGLVTGSLIYGVLSYRFNPTWFGAMAELLGLRRSNVGSI